MSKQSGWRKHRHLLFLLGILLVAFALRQWNMDFDPYTDGVPVTDDSEQKIRQAVNVAGGALAPSHFNQPYFLIYTTAAIYKLAGKTSLADLPVLMHWTPLYPIAFSMLTLLLVYWLTHMVYQNRVASLLAALVFAVTPMPVITSKHFKEDIPLMFFSTLTILLLIRLMRCARARDYMLAGVAIGLTIAVKYMGIILIPFLFAAHIVAARRSSSGTRRRLLVRPAIFGSLLAVILAFLVFNPYALLQARHFLQATGGQLAYGHSGHHTGVVLPGHEWLWTFYLRHTIIPGLTIPLALTALAGLIYSLRSRNAEAIFIVAWVALYYFIFEESPAKPFPFVSRYMDPILPHLCIFAGVGLHLLMAAGRKRVPAPVPIMVIGLLLLWPTVKTSLICDSLAHDTRKTAAKWMNKNLEAGSSILLDNIRFSPRPDRQKFQVYDKWRAYQTSVDKHASRGIDYLVVNSFKYSQYELGKHNTDEARRAHKYYVRLHDNYPLVKDFNPRFRFQTIAYHNPIIRVYRISDTPETTPPATP